MGTYTQGASSDYRNEGWSCVGGTNAWSVLSATGDDSKYISSPAAAQRATVGFPVNLSTTLIPEGAVFQSVTVYIRFKKNTTASTPVTVNVLSSLDPSKYTTRLLYPTENIETVEVGTYPRDTFGNPWGMYELNYLLTQVSTSAGLNNVNVYELYSVLNFRTRPTVTVTQPLGTVKTPTPLVSWAYAQTDGDRQFSVDCNIFMASTVNDPTFTPEVSDAALFRQNFEGDINSLTLPFSLTPGEYFVYLRVWSVAGAKSLWASQSFTVQGPAPGTPLIESVPLDNDTSSAVLTVRDTSNMLSTGQADAESGERLEFSAISCTIASSTSAFYGTGTASWKMTASGTNTMAANAPLCQISGDTPFTAVAQRRSAVTARYTTLSVLFYDVAYNYISSRTTPETDTTTTWVNQIVTGTTPSNAAYALVQLTVIAPVLNENHYFDAVGLMYGANATWSSGGHFSRNLLDSDYASHPGYANWTATAGTTVSNYTSGFTALGANNPNALALTGATVAPAIGYVNTGTVFTAATAGTDFTLNKPASVATGHLLVAYVHCDNPVSVTAPTGWTQVAHLDSGSGDQSDLTVLIRTAGASEPSTWTGSFSQNTARRQAVVVAYSGAANATEQFLDDNVSYNNSHSLNKLKSGNVNNTDANSWRVSAFAFNDPVSGGTVTANRQGDYVIEYIGAATPWTSDSANTTYVVNKPSGIISGDLMLASLSVDGNFSSSNFTLPSGWTLADCSVANAGTNKANTLLVIQRTAGGSEPNSWSGTCSSAMRSRVTGAVAYRGTETVANGAFIVDGISTRTSTSNSMTTPTFANTDSRAWSVSFYSSQGTGNVDRSVANSTPHADTTFYSTVYGTTASLALFDTSGTVSTGNHNYTAVATNTSNSGCSFMGYLKPKVTPPSPPANETQRAVNVAGSGYPWSMLSVFDSAGPVSTGLQSVTATQTPGSGSIYNSGTSWVGLIKPASYAPSGVVEASMTDSVDISLIDPVVLTQADNKITFKASFLGSVSGTASLKLDFYRANRYLTTRQTTGNSFGTTAFAQSSATFDLPEGTTNIIGTVSAKGVSVGDIVYVDQVGISLGDSSVWRAGTDLTTHPVWNQPKFQYAEDLGLGYGDWKDLSGTTTVPPLYAPVSGSIAYTDHTLVPGVPRKYRVLTQTYGLLGDIFISPYSLESTPVTLEPTQWWLKDLADPDSNLAVPIRAGDVTIQETSTATVFQPIGRSRPIVVTDGYKGDTFNLTMVLDKEQFVALKALVESGRTLYLQSDVDRAWWVRPTSGVQDATILSADRRTDPVRMVTVSFAEVDPVE